MTSPDFQFEDRRVIPVRYEGLDTFRVFAGLGVVLLHIYATIGLDTKSSLLIRLRDCAVPFFILSSVFILTRVLIRKPELQFKEFFYKRLTRLWVPFFIWTIIYTLTMGFVVPVIFGWNRFDFPPPNGFLTRLLSGYLHLWFLQFLFLASLLVYPAVKFFSQKKTPRRKIVVSCILAAIFFLLAFNLIHSHKILLLPESADNSLVIFIDETAANGFLVPLAIVLSLYKEEIDQLNKRLVFRGAGLFALFITMYFYLENEFNQYLRWAYSLMVFGAALQPWNPLPKIISRFASYSYAIYIIHVLPVYLLVILLRYYKIKPDIGLLLASCIIIYLGSFILAFLLRHFFPYDWFLPLVAVNHRSDRKIVSGEQTAMSGLAKK